MKDKLTLRQEIHKRWNRWRRRKHFRKFDALVKHCMNTDDRVRGYRKLIRNRFLDITIAAGKVDLDAGDLESQRREVIRLIHLKHDGDKGK